MFFRECAYLGELVAAPINHQYADQAVVLSFDQQHELLWAGAASGMIYTLQAPSLEPYAAWKAHAGCVGGLVPMGDGCALSVGAAALAMHTAGGVPRMVMQQKQAPKRPGGQEAAAEPAVEEEWLCCAMEQTHAQSRVLVGGSSGLVTTIDLVGPKRVGQSPVSQEAIVSIKATPGRGAVVMGTSSGQLLLGDSRRGVKADHTALAHAGGLAAMDARGDMVATCGYGVRMGQPVPDSMVKVFDLRYSLRPLFTLPGPSPVAVAWHPLLPMSLLMTGADGSFSVADVSNPASAQTNHVDTGGDALITGAYSPSGEVLAFAGSGGYVHVWAASHEPRCAAHDAAGGAPSLLIHPPPPAPPPPAPPPPSRGGGRGARGKAAAGGGSGGGGGAAGGDGEGVCSSAFPQHFCPSGRLLSDYLDYEVMDVGLPPRMVDEALKKNMKQVDFVGYIPNPHSSRSKPPGQARREASALQRHRQAPAPGRADAEAARAERRRRRAVEGGAVLPVRYRRVVIKAQSGTRFEDFDFSYYNRTRFAGLENDIPNCYCNALLQVLYFTPTFRAAVLGHAPEPPAEFCLACELLFLFRLMMAAGGTPCQASHLLRALRQNREAAALGLLEAGHLASGGPGDSRGVEAAVAQRQQGAALGRRIASLTRFLLEHLSKEARGESNAARAMYTPPPSPGGPPGRGATGRGAPRSPLSPARGAAASQDAAAAATGDAAAAAVAPERPAGDSALAAAIEDLLGLEYRSVMTALSGACKGESRERASRTFAVDLAYPSKDKGDTAAAAAAAGGGSAGAAAPTPPMSPAGPAAVAAGAGAGAAAAAAASCADKARFEDLLSSSLRAVTETRAWFDDGVGYAWVRQHRALKKLPKILVINVATTDPSDAALWDTKVTDSKQEPPPPAAAAAAAGGSPAAAAGEGSPSPAAAASASGSREGPLAPVPAADKPGAGAAPAGDGHGDGECWAPWALQVDASGEGGGVVVRGAPQLEDLSSADGSLTANYLLTGLICHIQDMDELDDIMGAAGSEAATPTPSEGAMPPGAGPGSSPAASASPGGPGARGGPLASQGHLVALIRVQKPYLDPETGMMNAAAAAAAAGGGAGRPGSGGGGGADQRGSGGGGGGAAAAARVLSFAPGGGGGGRVGVALPDSLDDVFADLALSSSTRLSADGSAAGGSRRASADGSGAASGRQTPPLPGKPPLPHGSSGAVGGGGGAGGGEGASGTVTRTSSGGSIPGPRQEWVVFNDFCITPVAAGEVMQWYGGQKRPCVLVYTQEEEYRRGDALPAPDSLPPAIDEGQFSALCAAPPLQGPSWPGPCRFIPLDMAEEAPRKGMLVAIDAEFVASSRAEASMGMDRSGQVQLKPSRLALARVSVLRGEGPRAGEPCIDDYVRSVEPVYDYLTRYSGIKPGDLDVGTSTHHLVTLKVAYLKLRYLLDVGCVFVGHGLKQDFRMLNLVVPQEQVRDTVDLFHFRRHRKLSLRFLASYILGSTIQDRAEGHDSVEDARTALRLYQAYLKMQEDGTFHDKLAEMYAYGRDHGWEPIPVQQQQQQQARQGAPPGGGSGGGGSGGGDSSGKGGGDSSSKGGSGDGGATSK